MYNFCKDYNRIMMICIMNKKLNKSFMVLRQTIVVFVALAIFRCIEGHNDVVLNHCTESAQASIKGNVTLVQNIYTKANVTPSIISDGRSIPSGLLIPAVTSSESDTQSQRKLQSTTGKFIGKFTIVKAEATGNVNLGSISRGTYMNGAIVDISRLFNDSLSLYVDYIGNFTSVSLVFAGGNKVEGSAPYALKGNAGSNFVAVPELKVPGIKTIDIKGFNGTKVIASLVLNFSIVAPPPIARPFPVPVPLPVPSVNSKPTAKPRLKPAARPSPFPLPIVMPLPPPAPVAVAPMNISSGKWIVTNTKATIEARHEACFVMVGRKAVLLGGRGKRRPNIYDPISRNWSIGAAPPNNITLHHMQCVAVKNKVWIVSSWTGGYPKETNAPFIYIYDPLANTWETRPPMPLKRRRGAAAVVAVGTDIYVAFGNVGGHETGDHATAYTWLDMYDTDTGRWTILPNATYPRDHTGGAYVNGKICVSGGRDGGLLGWPLVPQTECYDLVAKKWSVEANVSIPRAGSAYGSFDCIAGGGLLMAGGEIWGQPKARTEFDLFNGTHWISLSSMNIGRHSTGLAVDCECNAIYVASGSGNSGGSPELYSVETFFLTANDTPCRA
jgi:hypothetical protein